MKLDYSPASRIEAICWLIVNCRDTPNLRNKLRRALDDQRAEAQKQKGKVKS